MTIDLVDQASLAQIWQWNREVPEPVRHTVHGMLSETARQYPDLIAVDAHDGQLTYFELEKLSCKLGRELSEHELQGTIVPLLFQKSALTSVAILAVMKAGAATLLLDPAQPLERHRQLLEQTNSSLILTSEEHHSRCEDLALRTIILDLEELNTKPTPTLNSHILPDVKPSDRLYVQFTSGSTGQPKGVVITHSNFCSALFHQRKDLWLDATSRVLDFSSYSFDAAWFNLLHTLYAGGCLCVPSDYERQSDLVGAMQRLHANSAVLTPTLASVMDMESLTSLKRIQLAGEKVSSSLVLRLEEFVQVSILYGPAECTVLATMANDPFSIGQGVGLNTWIVDTNDPEKLTNIGEVGELWLEGPLVGPGYLGMAEKTAAAFVKDPSWLAAGSRDSPGRSGTLYRTGDLVRYKQDGSIEFIGRKDSQVKIRGQRVELGEVEHAVRVELDALDQSWQVFVELVADTDTGKQTLVAFLGPFGKDSTDNSTFCAAVEATREELRERLMERLPVYMVPDRYLAIEKLPKSAAGKTDRKRLRELWEQAAARDAKSSTARRRSIREPNSDKEIKLRQIWATVLGAHESQIGLDENFLAVGGDSIQAMRVVNAAQKHNITTTVREVLTSATLERLASAVASRADVGHIHQPKPFEVLRASGLVYEPRKVLESLKGDYAEDQIVDVLPTTDFQKLSLKWNVKDTPRWWCYFFVDFEHADSSILVAKCQRMWSHFDILRTAFVKVDGELLQVVLRDIPAPTIVYSNTRYAASPETLYEKDIAMSRKLGTIFTRFFITGEGSKLRLTLRLSHAQYDGISMGILMKHLERPLGDSEQPEPNSFAGYMKHALDSSEPAKQYWRSVLQGSQPTHVGGLASALTREEVVLKRTIHPLGSHGKATPAAIFTAACARALQRVSGRRDVSLLNVVSGRSCLPPISREAAGNCVNFAPVRLHTTPGTAFGTTLAAVQAQYIAGLPHETYGFDQIVAQCTDWPAGETFGCFVRYQNIDTQLAGTIEGEACAMRYWEKRVNRLTEECVQISAWPAEDRLDIMMSCGYDKRQTMQVMLDEICGSLEAYSCE